MFGDHMVLQRDVAAPIWGNGTPGADVVVTLGDLVARGRVADDGRWRVDLPPSPAGGPFELIVQSERTVRFKDVLVGEVWLCSGQSNMEMGLGVVENGAAHAAAADHPEIRLFEVDRRAAGEPQVDVDASWLVCTPDSVLQGDWGGFSAVAYFFGVEIQRELGVPIGLIDSAWGGTRIEPWTPPVGLASVPATAPLAREVAEEDRAYRAGLPARLEEIERWIAATRQALAGEERLPDDPWWPLHPMASSEQPSGLYHGMIDPLVPFAIRGALWYQGESNVHTHDGMAYFEKMKALIGGWRTMWGGGEFPFYFVQIAPFQYDWHQPGISPFELPRIQEAQAASLAIPATGMVVTNDIANLRDIHPGNKLEVGRRLSLLALARTYGREGIVDSGPLLRSMVVEGASIRLEFEHAEDGLASRDGEPLTHFEIAGSDQRFVAATATIDGGAVLVASDEVPHPVAARFAWHMLAEPNLTNAVGLPAPPFRTHAW